MRCTGFRRIALVLTILLLLIAPGLSQSPAERPLTNGDVVKMVEAGIPESVIVRKIEVSGTNFVTTPDTLISLKRQHVPDGVLGAMVDSEAGARMLQAVPPGVVYAGGPASPAHPHRLPNVDASFRIDSKTSGKVEVRSNQIKVEKAGVPLFSVKWKVNTAK